MKRYDKIVNSLNALPKTWYPALIIHLVEIAFEKKIFKGDCGITDFVRKIEMK